MRTRFTDELGYRFSAAYPIFERDRRQSSYVLHDHASDHEEAPALMVRAHGKAVRALPKETQLLLPGISLSPSVELD